MGYGRYVDVRRRTSTHVNVRRRTSTYVIARQRTSTYVDVRGRTSTYVDVCRRASTYVDVRPWTYVDVHGRTSTYVDIRRRTSTSEIFLRKKLSMPKMPTVSPDARPAKHSRRHAANAQIQNSNGEVAPAMALDRREQRSVGTFFSFFFFFRSEHVWNTFVRNTFGTLQSACHART